MLDFDLSSIILINEMIIVGLGNTGTKYDNTRHNIGFMVVQRVAEKLSLDFRKKQCESLVAEGYKNSEKFVLAKPQTYMNLSGVAVRQLMSFYNQPIEKVVVISDDIDLPLGATRIRKTGSAGTHNGLRNIIAETSSKDFIRIRVGVGEKTNKNMDLADYVLSKFAKSEMETVENAVENAATACIELIEGRKLELVMGSHNIK